MQAKSKRNRKKPETELFAFWIITFEPIKTKTCLASQSDGLNKGILSELQFCERNLGMYLAKIWLEMIVKRPFISSSKFWASVKVM